MGYYAQNQAEELDGEKTIFQTIDDEAVGEIRTQIRAMLGAFLFGKDEIDKKVKVLSGGEKARLALCKLLLKPNNFLVMDEPTNHLDLVSKEVLKQALMQYDGTLLLVSHDRDFLKELTDTVYEILPNRLKVWKGDVHDFLREKKAESIALYEKQDSKKAAPVVKEKVMDSAVTEDPKEKKRREQAIAKIEKQIEKLEEEIVAMQNAMADLDFTNHVLVQQSNENLEKKKAELDAKFAEWEKESQA
jgi:ATP-binding cassette subfamily F protein 3